MLYGAWARFPVSAEALEPLFKYIDRAWGRGLSLWAFAPSRQNDPALLRWWGRFERLGASPAAVTAVLQMCAETDVSDIVSSIRTPTLVIHCRGDTLIPLASGHFLAQNIPDARLVELPGRDHLFFMHEHMGDSIEEFVTGSVSLEDSERVLATVLFTDIVGSTARADELGDRRWQDLLEAHHASVRRKLARHRGREVKSLGDGFLALFDGPARAVRCARAIAEAVRPLELQVRCGLHTGEVEIGDDDIQGIAVHIASRVSALAGADEVWVSRTVKDLVAGSGLRFEARGPHALKGLPEPMEIYAVSL